MKGPRREHGTLPGLCNQCFPAGEGVASARQLLIRYGSREDVRRNLTANFYSEGWSGPVSVHYQAKLDDVRKHAPTETDLNALRWLREFEQSLAGQVDRERMQEERGF